MLSSTKAEIVLTRRPGRNWVPDLTNQRSPTSTSHLRRTVSLGIRSALARELAEQLRPYSSQHKLTLLNIMIF